MSKEFWVIKFGEAYVGQHFRIPKNGEPHTGLMMSESLNDAARYDTDQVYAAAKYVGGQVVLVREQLTLVSGAEQIKRRSCGDLPRPKTRESDGTPLPKYKPLRESTPAPKPGDMEFCWPQNIGWAIGQMRRGNAVYRKGWNGPDQYVRLQVPDAHSKMKLPYLYIRPTQGDCVPWAASQTDILADDWEVYAILD